LPEGKAGDLRKKAVNLPIIPKFASCNAHRGGKKEMTSFPDSGLVYPSSLA